jgi:hypothetical protein
MITMFYDMPTIYIYSRHGIMYEVLHDHAVIQFIQNTFIYVCKWMTEAYTYVCIHIYKNTHQSVFFHVNIDM